MVERVADDVWGGGIQDTGYPGNTSKDAALRALKKLAPDKVQGALLKATDSKNKQVKTWATAPVMATQVVQAG